MRVIVSFGAIALGLAITFTGCGSPPSADVDAAKAAIDRAERPRRSVCRRIAKGCPKCQGSARRRTESSGRQVDQLVRQDQGARGCCESGRREGGRRCCRGQGEGRRRRAAKQKADAAARARAKLVAPVRVGGQIKAPTKIKDVKPVYPAIARSARVAGVVTIEATIGADGKVIDAKVVRSVPLLDQAALDAVRQWEYTPTLLNGVPVPVVVTVTIVISASASAACRQRRRSAHRQLRPERRARRGSAP